MAEEIDVKPPTHIPNDWSCFLNHIGPDGRKVEIPSYFDKENWKVNMAYRMRVSNVYDPSHFWIVSKECELDAFHKYLHDFYSKYKSHYKIPEKNLKINMYCITFTDEAFYRTILVSIPLAIEKKTLAFVFLMDFGFMAKVPLNEIYFMTKQMYDVPQFAIRATLSGLGPVDSTTWSSEVVSKFTDLIHDKSLVCQVTNKNNANKVLYLRLGTYNLQTKSIESINDTLIMERLAKQMTIVDVKEMKHEEKRKGGKRSKKSKLPFLSPSFDELEKALCVDSLVAARCLEEFSYK